MNHPDDKSPFESADRRRADSFAYLLHLADNALVLAQRNSEWTGHGPVLEQDIAITNISLDLLGQARNYFQHAAQLYNVANPAEKQGSNALLPRPWRSFDRELNEDDLAFLRDEPQYLNLLITELPKGDWAFSVLRQFFVSTFQWLQYKALLQSHDAQIAAIAEKSLKETAYHLRWSSEWVIRLGDGTEESHGRMDEALKSLWPYTAELFQPATFEIQTTLTGTGVNPEDLKGEWMSKTASILEQATLTMPQLPAYQQGGKEGKHTEHMGYLLAEMQYLQRTYPNVTW